MLNSLKPYYHHYNHRLRWRLGHWKSIWNRQKTIAQYMKAHKVKKLQLGCGPHLIKGWLNSELYGSPEMIPLDLTKKFPVPDNSFDYLFCEHTIEHFSLEQGRNIFAEFFRVLKPGGKVRMATPDLKFLIDLYKKEKKPVQKRYIAWSSKEFFPKLGIVHETFVINNFVRAWGHQFIYDLAAFKILLPKAGFKNITKHKPGESRDKHLRGLELHGKSMGDEFNLLETLVVEATKP
ncbi:MAG: methyltransferase domain-containing protein [Microgenomates group bacterium]